MVLGLEKIFEARGNEANFFNSKNYIIGQLPDRRSSS